MSLKVDVREKSQGVFVLSPAGSLDSNTHQALETELEKVLGKKPGTVIFDLEDLKFISSIGLRIIFKTKKTLKQYGGIMALVNLQPQIKETFRIINALPSEPVFESMAELDEYLLAIQKKSLADD
jgi:stage II sporulation protein AA (anti-sigma F factor antagonist)